MYPPIGSTSEIIPTTGLMLQGNIATMPYRCDCSALSFKTRCAYGRLAWPTNPISAPLRPKWHDPMNAMSCHPIASARLWIHLCAPRKGAHAADAT